MARGPRAEFAWHGGAIVDRFHRAAIRGLTLAAEHLLTESRAIVPIDEGVLERSGAVSVDERGLSSAVSYDTPYAVEVHENLAVPHAPGRTAKYLEIPFSGESDTMRAILNTQMRKAAG